VAILKSRIGLLSKQMKIGAFFQTWLENTPVGVEGMLLIFLLVSEHLLSIV
jgi:hypothetical protein